MIKLQNSLLTDILPEQLAADREVQALAYAVGRQVEALCQAADKTIVWAALAEASDKVLDLLAAELRTPCYANGYACSGGAHDKYHIWPGIHQGVVAVWWSALSF